MAPKSTKVSRKAENLLTFMSDNSVQEKPNQP